MRFNCDLSSLGQDLNPIAVGLEQQLDGSGRAIKKNN